MPTRGYLSQSELPVTLGLGQATKAEDIEVVWPGGAHQKVANATLDGTTVVTEAAN